MSKPLYWSVEIKTPNGVVYLFTYNIEEKAWAAYDAIRTRNTEYPLPPGPFTVSCNKVKAVLMAETGVPSSEGV